MDKTYLITHSEGITKVKLLESINLEQGKQILDDIARNYPYERRLWDMNEINIDYSLDDLISIAEYSKGLFSNPNKLAINTFTDLTFGNMRQLAVYRQEKGKASAKVFRNEQEAIAWLNS